MHSVQILNSQSVSHWKSFSQWGLVESQISAHGMALMSLPAHLPTWQNMVPQSKATFIMSKQQQQPNHNKIRLLLLSLVLLKRRGMGRSTELSRVLVLHLFLLLPELEKRGSECLKLTSQQRVDKWKGGRKGAKCTENKGCCLSILFPGVPVLWPWSQNF